MPRLLLFDIDGTLLDTGGAGGASLLDAVEDLFSVRREELPPLNLAGATDGGLIRELFTHLGQPMQTAAVQRYLDFYLGHLGRRLAHADFPGMLLPGVEALLQTLVADGRADIGLLTGNVRRGAQMKLQRFGIHPHFVDGAFGDDAEDRNLLGPVAMRRMSQTTGRAYGPQDVIVIGDTPKDIACAHAMGARCLAVGTGHFDAASLRSHSPWLCLEDLSRTSDVCEVLLS